MPLPDDATLFIPYTLSQSALGWTAVQVDAEDNILFMSSVTWPTQIEAERHVHDLNWLREKALESLPVTNLWVAVDIAAEDAEALMVLERTLVGDHVIGWRLLNPGADEDNDAWEKARTMVQNAIDGLAQEELPEDADTLDEHLWSKHGVANDAMTVHEPDYWIDYHRRMHDDETAVNLDHTHEWPAKEVDDDADTDAPEGAHEDADR